MADDAGGPNRNPDPFFDLQDISQEVCNGGESPCPARQQCLVWSLQNNETDGVWGGLQTPQRNHLRRFHNSDEWDSESAPPLGLLADNGEFKEEAQIEEEGFTHLKPHSYCYGKAHRAARRLYTDQEE